MKNNRKYQGEPFSSEIASLIIDYETWTPCASFTAIVKHVRDKYREGGGSRIIVNLEDTVLRALKYSEEAGLANNIKKNIWRIARDDQQIWGDVGSEWVYLYYFSEHEKKAINKGHKQWLCNIGYTVKDPEARVKNQTRGVPVPPIIGLLLRTENGKALEKAIHAILTLHGRHQKTQGREWFITGPDEVTHIYNSIRAVPILTI